MPDGAIQKGMFAHVPSQARNINQPVLVYVDIRGALNVRPLIEILSVPGKKLNTVRLAAADHDALVGSDADSVRQMELARTGTGLAPRLD